MEQQFGLFAKMAAIMGEVDRIAKDGKSSQLPYKFAKDSDVFDTIRAKLAEHRIAFFSETLDAAQDNITSRNNVAGYHTTLSMRFTLACADTGQTMQCLWRAESDSYDDKGTSKAQTLGQKYFLLKTFVLSTGDPKDDPDSVNEEASSRATRKSNTTNPRRYPEAPAQGPAQHQRGTSEEPPAETMRGEMPAAALETDPVVDRAQRTFPFAKEDKGVNWQEYIKTHKSWTGKFWPATKALGYPDNAAVHAALNIASVNDWNGTVSSLWFNIVKNAPPEQQELRPTG
jgi:hypothetical protein